MNLDSKTTSLILTYLVHVVSEDIGIDAADTFNSHQRYDANNPGTD